MKAIRFNHVTTLLNKNESDKVNQSLLQNIFHGFFWIYEYITWFERKIVERDFLWYRISYIGSYFINRFPCMEIQLITYNFFHYFWKFSCTTDREAKISIWNILKSHNVMDKMHGDNKSIKVFTPFGDVKYVSTSEAILHKKRKYMIYSSSGS